MQTTQRSRTKVIQVIVHTIAWAMMFCSPLFFSQGEGNSISWARYLGFCASPLAFMLVFYPNYFVLIDRLLFRKRLGTFVLINLLLIILLAVGLHGWHEFHRTYVMGIPPSSRPRARTQFYLFFMLRDAVTMLLVTGLSVAIKMTGRWYRVEREKQEIEKERTQAELQNLKSQLNPHFLFNTLNNIYALVALNPQQAQYALHSLSQLLRYVLYDNNQQMMPLSKELAFIRSYVELMSLRLSKQVQLEVNLPEDDRGYQVAPLLFIALIENAFKHGVSATEPSFIHISFALTGGDTLICTVENSCFPKNELDRSGSGIGLENLRRRLSLLYPGQHILRMEKIGEQYVAQLILTLKPHVQDSEIGSK